MLSHIMIGTNDIERATRMARSMVTKWGLSETLGPLQYEEDDQEVFLGKSAGSSRSHVSGETAKVIDEEVKKIIDSCYEKARTILVDNRDKLDARAVKMIMVGYSDSNKDEIGRAHV